MPSTKAALQNSAILASSSPSSSSSLSSYFLMSKAVAYRVCIIASMNPVHWAMVGECHPAGCALHKTFTKTMKRIELFGMVLHSSSAQASFPCHTYLRSSFNTSKF